MKNRRCRELKGRYLLLLGCTAIGISPSVIADHVTFAEPYSGRKVAAYSVSLPDGPDQRSEFSVPVDCDKVREALARGANRYGNPVDKRMWLKVESDCRFHRFMHPQSSVQQDFVSGYDFYNAPFEDLPVREACEGEADCPPLPPGVADIAALLPSIEPSADSGQESESCGFRDGLFRGHLIVDPAAGLGGVRCIPDPRAAGFRVIAVDYADVNGDGFLDAVLRLIPLSAGVSRAPLLLPVTRFQPEGPFVLPPGIEHSLPTY